MDIGGMEGAVPPPPVNGDYRVLRRVALPAGPSPTTDLQGSTTVAAVVDIETTGLDAREDRIIELAIRRFRFDAAGRIVKLDRGHSWREDPGRPLGPEIVKLTGLTDADLAGQEIDDALADSLLLSADVIVAHNARFDRPGVEQRLPNVRGLPWACSCNDVDWGVFGFEGGRNLPWLLAQCGWFYDAHRAQGDVDAVVALLAHPLPTGRTALAEMIANAEAPSWHIRARGAGYSRKDVLKARGYRWDGDTKVWHREVRQEALADEQYWLAQNVYYPEYDPRAAGPLIDEVTWRTRYARPDLYAPAPDPSSAAAAQRGFAR